MRITMNKTIVIISVFLLFSCNQVADKPERSKNPVSSTDAKIEKAFISFRISTYNKIL